MLIAGNWKMNMDLPEAKGLARGMIDQVDEPKGPKGVQVALCPPFVSLAAVHEVLRGTSIRLGAQNMHHEEEGAYTGEISAGMLRSVGCDYVILGHSERRQYFGETDEGVNRKVHQAKAHRLIPIVCVGETLEEREAGREQSVVRRQVERGLEGLAADEADALVLAYEPVWAIGTGRTASPEQAQEMHAFLRELLRDLFDAEVAGRIQILYGGSMKPGNAAELLQQPDVDGGLVGGASLKADQFAAIVRAGEAAA